MCSCSEVSQSVKNSATPTPVTASSPAIAQTPKPLPMISAWNDAIARPQAPTNIGRDGLTRSEITSPATDPSPKATVTIAQSGAPPCSFSKSTGPRTKTAGSTTTW